MLRIITGILCLAVAVIFFALGILQLNEKGPVMNNTWFYASDKEREQIDKKFCYRQAGVIFMIAGGIFLLNAAGAFFKIRWMIIPVIALTIIELIYAVVSSGKSTGKSK